MEKEQTKAPAPPEQAIASEWRYERKFRLEAIDRALAMQVVRCHPAGFRQAYPDRWVNNIYFDDPDLTALYDNFAGAADRQKVRLRWYGPAFPGQMHPARLEWKMRSNQLGKKRVVALPPLSFESMPKLRRQLREYWRPASVRRPVLLNRYRRSYYAAAAGSIRLTIDWDLSFGTPRAIGGAKKLSLAAPGGIVELKYPPAEEARAAWIMQHLPFRLTKSSKYVAGLMALYGR